LEDLSILRRSILWNLQQKEFPAITSRGQNSYEVELALRSAYQQFVFITAEVEDREEVALQAAKLVEDLWEPAVRKIDTGYAGNSEDREVTAFLNAIVRDNPLEPSSSPVNSTRSLRR
jgi:hypothetical protein